jgi:hypothetical protein
MKKANSKEAGRRQFLKKAGALAAGLAIGPAVTKAQTPAPRGPRRAVPTYKLGEIDPKSPRPPFKKKTRLPGWHPDEIDDASGRNHVFPEEAIGRDNALIPFKVNFNDGPGRWRDWLGTSLPNPTVGEPRLRTLVREVAKRARNYNSTLFLLRQYHYAKEFPSSTLPTQNLKGPKNPQGRVIPNPIPTSPTFDDDAIEAEEAWAKAAGELENLLKPGGAETFCNVTLIAADMVEVNNYIISMRVVTDDPLVVKDRKFFELSGSSSHISISSAFSWSP